jgi:adenylate kinase
LSELNLILVGPPGAGKGTQAERLTDDFGLPYFATGNMLREAVANGTDLGKKAKSFMDAGELVTDEVIIGMILESLAGEDARDGFLLDGFPRNVPQAETLKKQLMDWDTRLTVVLELVVDEDEVVRRLSGRRTCRRCERVWHVMFDPPTRDGICDACGGELFQRDDDREQTVRHRLEVYKQQTAPLVSYYADEGVLIGIDATGPVEEVTERALAALRPFAR